MRWNKKTSDGTPFVLEYKKTESPASIKNSDSHIIYIHPFKTGTVIKQNGHLYLERAEDGEKFNDKFPILDDVDISLKILS